MWFARLKLLVNPNRHSAIAFLAIGLGVLFVGGGLAVNQQLSYAQRTSSVVSTTTTTKAPTATTFAPYSPAGPEVTAPANPEAPLPSVAPGQEQPATIVTTPGTSPRPITPPVVGGPAPTTPPRVTSPGQSPSPSTAPPATPIPAAVVNGPSLPTVDVSPDPERFRPEDPEVAITSIVADDDGYVSRIDIDWNDGSAPDVIEYSLSNCSIPSRPGTVNRAHTFEAGGSYNISVTVTSVSCNGGGAQQAIGVLTVNTPGPTTELPL